MSSHLVEGFVSVAKYDRNSISSSNDVTSCGSSISPYENAGSISPSSTAMSPTDIKPDPDADYFGSPSTTSSAFQSPTDQVDGSGAVIKRPRGRPRKHPIKSLTTPDGKSNKGRSKTGCITCRRRKKKCDEAKPECENCKKNNVACEGYRLPEQWHSSRKPVTRRQSDLPPLFEGVENDVDSLLFRHFSSSLSHMLCMTADGKSPINDIILPMAVHDQGLMHSVLCLAGYQLVESTGGGPVLDESMRQKIIERMHHHCFEAISLLRQKDLGTIAVGSTVDDSTIAQIMMLCLQTIMAGESKGEHRAHLDTLRCILAHQRSENDEFQRFAEGFFLFHNTCSAITCIPPNRSATYFPAQFRLPGFVPPEAGSYFGVLEGLFLILHQITELRDRIRKRRLEGHSELDFPTLHDAQRIDDELKAWTCHYPADSTMETASYLYRECTWIYLHRTILPFRTDRVSLRTSVTSGLQMLQQLRTEGSCEAILLMPLFLLGCAAFEQSQRQDIDTAFDHILERRGSANVRHARNVVKRIWHSMDNGDENSWDWETAISSMELDFLVS